ncbi:MAG TPA: S41 family peptidase [Gemmatimonadota bacterium]|nr:S41 family peptidase [Gemmatimonadota bacterium]
MSWSHIALLRLTTAGLLVATLSTLNSCETSDVTREVVSSGEVENLRAFAKLYGYVRFFHPSDEAAAVDWDRFAVYGAARVKSAGSGKELRETLTELFLPIAPAAQIYATDAPPLPLPLAPEETGGLSLVAWQHSGVGLGPGTIYQSKRLNRTLQVQAASVGFGSVTQVIDPDAYRGKRIKLIAFVRTEVEGDGNQAQLWLRVDRPTGQLGFFENMSDRPITSRSWGSYEIEGEVAEDAIRIAFGCLLAGQGKAWVDDVELLVAGEDGAWEPIEIANPGFEEGDSDAAPPGWAVASPGYVFRLDTDVLRSGARAISIEDGWEAVSGWLFDAHPELGEVIEAEIGLGLSCRVPLALLGDDSGTWSPEPRPSSEQILAALDSVGNLPLTANSEAVRLADIIIAWNVFQHFYPYFDVVDVDWDAQLTLSLRDALSDQTGQDFFRTLSRLVAGLQDGHGNVFHPEYYPRGRLPFVADWIEERVVVTRSDDLMVRPGDIIEQIDGVEARRAVADAELYTSGSPQWKRFKALRFLGAGPVGTLLPLVVRRGDERLDLQVERVPQGPAWHESPLENFVLLDEGVYYVNLSTADIAEIDDRIDALAAARGIVFDLRGYPNSNHKVLSYLLTSPDTSDAWMRVPQVIHPDHRETPGYRNNGWSISALSPHLDGRIVFITDGRAISYAESFMSFVEHYRLGEIVGQPTAGTNGNVNNFVLPGAFTVMWTGMRVVKHDGSQHHLVGIRPTVPAERTIQGVREGRDELIEVALDVINQGGPR